MEKKHIWECLDNTIEENFIWQNDLGFPFLNHAVINRYKQEILATGCEKSKRKCSYDTG